MSKSSNLMSFYRKLLDYININVEDDGRLTYDAKNNKGEVTETLPWNVKIGGKARQLVLPTEDWVNAENNGTFVLFHPLAENALRPTSEVFTALLSKTRLELNIRFSKTANLILINGMGDNYDNLKQAAYDHVYTDIKVSNRLKQVWISGIAQAMKAVNKHFRANVKKATSGERIATWRVDFPNKAKEAVNKKSINAMLDILPTDIEIAANSVTAPNFVALLNLLHVMFDRYAKLNGYFGRYGDSSLKYDGSLKDDIENLDDYYDELYIQPEGNVGTGSDTMSVNDVATPTKPAPSKKEQVQAVMPPARNTQPQQPHQQPQQPQQQYNPPPVQTNSDYAAPPPQVQNNMMAMQPNMQMNPMMMNYQQQQQQTPNPSTHYYDDIRGQWIPRGNQQPQNNMMAMQPNMQMGMQQQQMNPMMNNMGVQQGQQVPMMNNMGVQQPQQNNGLMVTSYIYDPLNNVIGWYDQFNNRHNT